MAFATDICVHDGDNDMCVPHGGWPCERVNGLCEWSVRIVRPNCLCGWGGMPVKVGKDFVPLAKPLLTKFRSSEFRDSINFPRFSNSRRPASRRKSI